jgi:hypothetical protein
MQQALKLKRTIKLSAHQVIISIHLEGNQFGEQNSIKSCLEPGLEENLAAS